MVDLLQNSSFRSKVASDIGQFVACVASLEFEIDDLLGLANSRVDVKEAGVTRYPVQLSQKIIALGKIASSVGFKWDIDWFKDRSDRITEIRQYLVHGRVTGAESHSVGYSVNYVKMSLPQNENGIQKLMRESGSFPSSAFVNCFEAISELEMQIELLRVEIFNSGDGWPSYLALPTAKPFDAKAALSKCNKVQT